MANISFSSEIEIEKLQNALDKEHVDNFINSPGLNQVFEGDRPISRRQLTRKLYNHKTNYPTGKLIEYYLEGDSALEVPVRCNGKLLQKVKLQKLSFSDVMNTLYDAIELYKYYCTEQQLNELLSIKNEFAKSQYQYEYGKQLENILIEGN